MILKNQLIVSFICSALALAACSGSDDAAETGDGDGDSTQTGSGSTSSSGGTTGEGTGGTSPDPSGGTNSGGTDSGGTSSGGADPSGGQGGEAPVAGKPDLSVTLDDVEAYNVSDMPTAGGWSKWDPDAHVSDAFANSGTKSIGFFDTTGLGDVLVESPEIQRVYGAVTEGVFKGSIYIVPESVTARSAYFTIFSESASSTFRLADFRFDGDGSVKWRDSAVVTWTDVLGVSFTPNTWTDIEIAWNSAAGSTGQVWLTVGDTELAPINLYSSSLSQIFTIKLGDTEGKDDTAAMYLDDFGLQLRL